MHRTMKWPPYWTSHTKTLHVAKHQASPDRLISPPPATKISKKKPRKRAPKNRKAQTTELTSNKDLKDLLSKHETLAAEIRRAIAIIDSGINRFVLPIRAPEP